MLGLVVALTVLCGPADEVAAWLRDAYGEALYATALDAGGGLIEIWASQHRQTMTIVRRLGGSRCIVLTATDWSPTNPT